MEVEVQISRESYDAHEYREYEIHPLRRHEEVQHHVNDRGHKSADGTDRHIERQQRSALVLVRRGDAHHAHRRDVDEGVREPEADVHDHRPRHFRGLLAGEREIHENGHDADHERADLHIRAHFARFGARLVDDYAHERVRDHVADPAHQYQRDDEPPRVDYQYVCDVTEKIRRYDARHHVASHGGEPVGKFLFAPYNIIGIAHS